MRIACAVALVCAVAVLRSDERATRAPQPALRAATAIASAKSAVTPPAAGASATDAASLHRRLELRRSGREAEPKSAFAASVPSSRLIPRSRAAARRADAANAVDVQDYFITQAAAVPQPLPAVDAGMVGFALESADFADIVALLAEQSAGDDLLVQLNDFYRDAIRNQLAETEGDMRLEHLACGVTLCIGEIVARSDNDEWLAWEERFDEDAGMRAGEFSEYTFEEQAGGLVRHRFLFVIDPAINVGVVRY